MGSWKMCGLSPNGLFSTSMIMGGRIILVYRLIYYHVLPTTLPEAETSIEGKREHSFTLDLKTCMVRMEHSISGGRDSGYTSSTARIFLLKRQRPVRSSPVN